eukprot:82085_1
MECVDDANESVARIYRKLGESAYKSKIFLNRNLRKSVCDERRPSGSHSIDLKDLSTWKSMGALRDGRSPTKLLEISLRGLCMSVLPCEIIRKTTRPVLKLGVLAEVFAGSTKVSSRGQVAFCLKSE